MSASVTAAAPRMVVKVQRRLAGDGPEFLVYDRARTVYVTMGRRSALTGLMGGRAKVYFDAALRAGVLEVGAEAVDQDPGW